jgi:hypothetical protein
MLTLELLKQRLDYDQTTGEFRWATVLPKSSAKIGDLAGSTDKTGRLQLRIDGTRYYGHQLAWMYSCGSMPKLPILHKNGNFADNRLANLELCLDCTKPMSAELLKELFVYDHTTGEFRRRGSVGGSTRAGEIVGHVHGKRGYKVILIAGKSYQAHRLAWWYMAGVEPTGEVDHINGCRSDNRWDNLRLATKEQNQHNAKLRTDNTSGTKGMYRNGNFLECRVACEGEVYYKCFKVTEESLAIVWLQEARARLHGEFSNNG